NIAESNIHPDMAWPMPFQFIMNPSPEEKKTARQKLGPEASTPSSDPGSEIKPAAEGETDPIPTPPEEGFGSEKWFFSKG
ncbi:MAG: hypothetical protein ACI97B_003019, partial [Verrucomicrobiales bacterium]